MNNKFLIFTISLLIIFTCLSTISAQDTNHTDDTQILDNTQTQHNDHSVSQVNTQNCQKTSVTENNSHVNENISSSNTQIKKQKYNNQQQNSTNSLNNAKELKNTVQNSISYNKNIKTGSEYENNIITNTSSNTSINALSNTSVNTSLNTSNTYEIYPNEPYEENTLYEEIDFDIDSVLAERVDVVPSYVTSGSDNLNVSVTNDIVYTLYVNEKTGDDTYSGDSTNPLKTVDAAINKTGKSNSWIINISDGTYSVSHRSIDNRVISFVGNGMDNTILTFNDNEGWIIGTSTISLEKLTITNANNSGKGGAFKINSNVILTVNDCKFTNNHAEIGGVIFTPGIDNKIFFNNCIFKNNSAKDKGGALSITNPNSEFTISNCYFTNNSCEDDILFERLGGAIYSGNQSISYINACNFTNNTAFNGTCIFTGGDANLEITNCNLTDNYAVHGTTTETKTRGALVIGSGVFNMGNCYFANNTADYGAAISVNSGEEVNIESSIFYQNTAYTLAGAIYNYGDLTITNSQFIKNNGTRRGGAIVAVGDRTINVSNTTFVDNKVNTRSLNETIIVPQGGAISVSGPSKLYLDYCTFDHNSALYGGAIYVDVNASNVLITNTVFRNNTASYGGAIIVASNDIVNINNSVFDVNRALKKGGAIILNGSLSVELFNTNFTNNNLTNETSEGGAIYILEYSTINSGNNIFRNNTALANGGAICSYSGIKFIIDDTDFIGNNANQGGAIYINNKNDLKAYSKIELVRCVIANNTGGYELYSSQSYDSTYNNNTVSNSKIESGASHNFNILSTVSLEELEVLRQSMNEIKSLKTSEANYCSEDGNKSKYLLGMNVYRELETDVNYSFNAIIINKSDLSDYENYNFKWYDLSSDVDDLIIEGNAFLNVSFMISYLTEGVRWHNGNISIGVYPIKVNQLMNITFSIEGIYDQEFKSLDHFMVGNYSIKFRITDKNDETIDYLSYPIGLIIHKYAMEALKSEFPTTAYSGDTLTSQLFPPDVFFPSGYEEFASFLVTFAEHYGGLFNFYVNNDLYLSYDTAEVDLDNLVFTYKIPEDYDGQLNLSIVYITEENVVTTVNFTTLVNVTRSENIPVVVTGGNIVENVNSSITFSGNVKNEFGNAVDMGTVVIKLNGVTQARVNVSNGTFIYITDEYYGAGQYDLTYVYVSNEKYARSEAEYVLDVNKYNAKVAGSDLSGCVNETILISGTLTDSDGNPINGTVVIKINGNTFARVSVKNGVYSYNYTIPNYSIKDYVISYVYPGDNRYDRVELNKTLTITKQKVVIETNKVSGVAGETVNLTGNIKTYDGTSVTTGILNIKLNSNTIARIDVTSSTFNYKYTLPADYTAKDYNLTYVYGQNNKYDRAENSTTLTIENQTSNIQIKNVTTNGSTIKITAEITGSVNGISALAGNAGFKINGITAKNSDGNPIKVNVRSNIVEFTYTLPENYKSGDYNITVTYSGGRNLAEGRNSSTFYINIDNLLASVSSKNIKMADENIIDIYVSSNGSDSNIGSESSPYQTIDKAISSTVENNSYMIYIGNGTYNVSQQSISSKSITFISEDKSNTIFDFNQHAGFIVSGEANVTFINLTFTNANSSTDGGVIWADLVRGTVEMDDCIATNNHALSGGVLFVKGDMCFVHMKNCTFINNSAVEKGGVFCSISNDIIDVSIDDSIFNDNYAISGGALYYDGDWGMIISNSIFDNNIADYGGVIALNQSNSITDLENSIFTNNKAIDGGVIYMESYARLLAYDSFFINNTATETGGVIGVYNYTHLLIHNTTLNDNKAELGGVFFINNSNVNTIWSDKSDVNFDLCTVVNNTGVYPLYSTEAYDNDIIINKIKDVYFGEDVSRFYAYNFDVEKIDVYVYTGDYNGAPGENITISGSFGAHYFNVTNGTVVLKLNGKTIARVNLTNGIYSYTYTIPSNYSPKDYILTIVYTENSEYGRKELNKTLTISKPKVVFKSSNVYAYAGNMICINATVKDKFGEDVDSGLVSIKINGKTVGQVNVTNGMVSFNYTIPDDYSAKKYNISFVYGEDSKYARVQYNTVLTIQNYTSEIEIKNVTCDNRTLKITAEITGNNKEIGALAGNAGFKINGITAKNSDGNPIKVDVRSNIVEFTYTLPDNYKTGTYNITVTYSGGRNLSEGRNSTIVEIKI